MHAYIHPTTLAVRTFTTLQYTEQWPHKSERYLQVTKKGHTVNELYISVHYKYFKSLTAQRDKHSARFSSAAVYYTVRYKSVQLNQFNFLVPELYFAYVNGTRSDTNYEY